MLMIRRKMDAKKIGSLWEQFLKLQICELSSQTSSNEDLTKNPYYSKYADKLKQTQLNKPQSIDYFELNDEEKSTKEKYVELERKLTKKADVASQATGQLGKTINNKIKNLDDVIKLDLIKNLDRNAVEQIWFEYFKNKDCTIFAFIDDQNYDRIKANIVKHPVFVFLLPLNQKNSESTSSSSDSVKDKMNYQFVLVQFRDNPSTKSMQCYFTPLAFYHLHKENAPASLILNYYTDIKDDKGIVLMEGEYDNKILNLLEAQCLANQIQIFYPDQDKQYLLNKFTNDPNSFDYMDMVKVFEKSFKI